MRPSQTREDLERLTQWTLGALDLVVAFGVRASLEADARN
jgi:hypothetical protein